MSDGESPSTAEQAPAADPRPWWKKKRFLIPIAVVVLVVAVSTAGDEGDDSEELAAADETDEEAPDEPEESEEPEGADAEDEPDDDAAQESEAGAEGEHEPEPDEETPAGDDEAADEETDSADDNSPPELPAFDPETFEGTGDDVIDVPVVEDALVVATLEHSGASNFAVTSYDEAGGQIDLLVNAIGSYAGTVPYNFQTSPAELEIQADGPWTVTLAGLGDRPVLEDRREGSGDDVLVVAGEGRLDATHDGEGNFALQTWGEARDLLVNEIGAYEGTVRLGRAIAMQITADGAWTLAVE